jgi:hypothetical protein
MQTLIFFATALLPPLISGPLPAMLVFTLGGVSTGLNWRRKLALAIFLAIVLNLVACAVIIFNLNGLLPPGLLACVLTPIAALATLIVSLLLFHRSDPGSQANPIQRKWLHRSLVAIPLLQVLMLGILVLIAPALCGTSMHICPIP